MSSLKPILIVGLIATLGCQSKTSDAPPAPTSTSAATASLSSSAAPVTTTAESAAGLTLVTDPSLVCMVNNQFMGAPQIPIEVDGRTYYGCCEMCKGRLAKDPSSRMAADPVSHASVDKATAVIGKTKEGRILYFESPDTFGRYAREAD